MWWILSRGIAWYSKLPMGIKTIRSVVKNIFAENGLNPEDYSNKSGRTTHITRMAAAGVPAEVGMLITGEWFLWVFGFVGLWVFYVFLV
jgi:hypothetical protein